MLNLIIAVLLNLGFNADGGKHFSMNSHNAQHIRQEVEFNKDGGDEEFKRFVLIDNSLPDDIIVTDEDQPSK